jgi:hypothetical protein
LLLECGDLDCYVFVEEGGGFGRLNGSGAGPGSSVEEAPRAPSLDVPYRARSSLTRMVAVTAR